MPFEYFNLLMYFTACSLDLRLGSAFQCVAKFPTRALHFQQDKHRYDGNNRDPSGMIQRRLQGSPNIWLRLLSTMLIKRNTRRSNWNSARSCFGGKLDRIGALSGLGC
uniref:C-type natriuretic peptide n=1 Tax=Eptatretus burgeri TaxID=7764 RepID=A0A8C4N2K5_EPTBU